MKTCYHEEEFDMNKQEIKKMLLGIGFIGLEIFTVCLLDEFSYLLYVAIIEVIVGMFLLFIGYGKQG